MKFLGPPPRGPVTPEAWQGEQVFRKIGCASCHVPSFKTGASLFKALSFKRFFPYGDFLLHDIWTGDGIVQGQARPEEIRTPPLWGLRVRAPFLHDGRASTLREAVELRAGEAAESRDLYEKLPDPEKKPLVAFLGLL
jgi:CxxC motif-containing protein (DUF1111 family)